MMKCYYHYLSKRRKSLQTIILSNDDPFIAIDIDQDGNSMGIEYIDD